MASYLSSYTLLLVIFNIVVTSKLSTGTRNHAYFSPNEDSQFIGDNIPVTFHKDFSGTTGKHLGIPHHERVTIINLSCNRTILMSSISGSTVHFHSSFFQDKIIPPLGNTSFSVVFLGRGEGEIKSYLYIHTSEGSFKYQVRGESVGSPYRLRSLSGIKLPLNATYTPEIFMHNPHSTVLQILEVYSSGNDFHLELPSGDLGGPKHIWQIPAFFTKPIIRLKFHASSQKNHSAYVRLKLDRGEQVLMIPVDVEVGSVCGLYSHDDLINFGFGGTLDPPKKIKLFLKNSAKKPVKVVSVSTSPVSKAIKIDFKPTFVPPQTKTPTEVAALTFDWQAAYRTGVTSGNIIVKSNQFSQKLILRYYASVLEGGLEYDSSQVKFKSDESEVLPRLISLKNNFKIPVIITGVSLRQSAAPFFQVKNFSSTSISPGETKPIFVLEAKKNFIESDLLIESGIHISTNASALVIPLLCFNGKLKKVSTWETEDETLLDVGSVAAGDNKLFYFGLINENPISVYIKTLALNISDASIGIVAVERGNATRAMHAISGEYGIDSKTELNLAPRSFCVIQVSIPGQDVGCTYGLVSVTTAFEEMNFNVKFSVKEGNNLKVSNNAENIENCFQADICPTPMVMEPRYSVSIFDAHRRSNPEQAIGFLTASHILPLSKILNHYYNWNFTSTPCFTSNMTGAYNYLNAFHLPLLSNQLDVKYLMRQYENYLKLSSELMKLTYWMNTTEVVNMSFKSLLKPEWPSIRMIESRFAGYPSSFVTNSSYRDLIVTKPKPVKKPKAKLILEPSYPVFDSFQMSSNSTSFKSLKHHIGRGNGQVKIGNRKSGSYTILIFELTEKHLRVCERMNDRKNNKPFFSVRLSFFAKNTGSLPLSVIGFVINGQPCEGFGFQVINCEPFTLPANTSKKIDIAFTPDFTLSKITRLLTVLTLDSSVNYTLVATLPPYLLSVCNSYIKRPSWEPLVYYSAVSFMLFLLICILGAAFFESNRILRNTIITLSRDNNFQPILDLRMIGSEPISPPEQSTSQVESQCKIVWTSNAYTEEQVTKDVQKPITESIFSINCSNKCQILNNGINCKKKTERTICKRFSDDSENYIEKTCWESSFSRTNNTQPMKTSICITTEPYIPLSDLKTRDHSLPKPDFSSPKFDQPKFIEFQRRKTKKKSQVVNSFDLPKKKSVDLVPIQDMFEESESSPHTSESSCSDDGEKDVESMFFQSVRHHLQSKVTRGRPMKMSSSSPLIKRKKSLEKSPANAIEHEWDIEEDETSEKATVVRNNRRSSSSAKQIKKQTANYGKMRFEQNQNRGKQSFGERSMKSMRKEKAQSGKKRNERMEKRVSSAKATTLAASHDGIPAVPSPPVWTASFSDVVAGTDPSYSSVVATKNSSNQNQKHQLNICTQDPVSSCSGNTVSNFSSGWKNEYQDALEQQESANEHVPIEMKQPLNSIWSNWSSLAGSIQNQSSVLQNSANSLFTDGSTQSNAFDPLWNDHNVIKAVQDCHEVDTMFQGVRNELNWPILTSLWEPLYTPSSTVETPPPVWGSDVWGPPVSPPIVQPPASDDLVQPSYDPFRSLSNIWGHHTPNIWKPPTTE